MENNRLTVHAPHTKFCENQPIGQVSSNVYIHSHIHSFIYTRIMKHIYLQKFSKNHFVGLKEPQNRYFQWKLKVKLFQNLNTFF